MLPQARAELLDTDYLVRLFAVELLDPVSLSLRVVSLRFIE